MSTLWHPVREEVTLTLVSSCVAADAYSCVELCGSRRLLLCRAVWQKTLTLVSSCMAADAYSCVELCLQTHSVELCAADAYSCVELCGSRRLLLCRAVWQQTLTLVSSCVAADAYSCVELCGSRRLLLCRAVWQQTLTCVELCGRRLLCRAVSCAGDAYLCRAVWQQTLTLVSSCVAADAYTQCVLT
ncbi:hypothetical protein J6590_049310 [Homalodisca vitripennis]|nr:hypothetical protein J6590_049310 [Homalodisca vitripennis]